MKKPGQFPGSILFVNFIIDVFVHQGINRRYCRLVFVVFLLGAIRHEIFKFLVQGGQLFQCHCKTFASCFVKDSALYDYLSIGAGSHLVMCVSASRHILWGIIRVNHQRINGCVFGVGAVGLDCYFGVIAGAGRFGYSNFNRVMFNIKGFHNVLKIMAPFPGPG